MAEVWIKKMQELTEKFWKEEYPQKTSDAKVKYWKETLEKGMKEQEKLGLPLFSVFNKNWYESVKELEPEIDTIIDILFKEFWTNKDKNDFMTTVSKDDELSEEEE